MRKYGSSNIKNKFRGKNSDWEMKPKQYNDTDVFLVSKSLRNGKLCTDGKNGNFRRVCYMCVRIYINLLNINLPTSYLDDKI